MAPSFGISTITNFLSTLRELNPDEIVRDAEQSFGILIAGEPGAGKRTLRSALAGGAVPSDLALPYLRTIDGIPSDTFGATLCLYVLDASRGLFEADWKSAQRLAGRGIKLVYVYNKMDLVPEPGLFREQAERTIGGIVSAPLVFIRAVDAEDVARNLVPAMLDAAPDLCLALGRRLPVFRREAATRAILEISRVNAEFALISSIPAVIPLVNLGVMGADTLVLTKNQALLLIKLAAIYGRGLSSKRQLLVEVAPVVGAAFLWRTLARSLVTLLPGFIAAAPKTLIAYVGTFVIGRTAEYYYRLGKRPSREVLEYYSREALGFAQRALPDIDLASARDKVTETRGRVAGQLRHTTLETASRPLRSVADRVRELRPPRKSGDNSTTTPKP